MLPLINHNIVITKLKLDEHYFLYEVTFEAVVGICLQREVSTLVHRPTPKI